MLHPASIIVPTTPMIVASIDTSPRPASALLALVPVSGNPAGAPPDISAYSVKCDTLIETVCVSGSTVPPSRCQPPLMYTQIASCDGSTSSAALYGNVITAGGLNVTLSGVSSSACPITDPPDGGAGTSPLSNTRSVTTVLPPNVPGANVTDSPLATDTVPPLAPMFAAAVAIALDSGG